MAKAFGFTIQHIPSFDPVGQVWPNSSVKIVCLYKLYRPLGFVFRQRSARTAPRHIHRHEQTVPRHFLLEPGWLSGTSQTVTQNDGRQETGQEGTNKK